MLRGFRLFKCDECKHKFKAIDIELMATVWSMPQPCPKCKSKHTYPWTLFGSNRSVYAKVWKMLEENQNER